MDWSAYYLIIESSVFVHWFLCPHLPLTVKSKHRPIYFDILLHVMSSVDVCSLFFIYVFSASHKANSKVGWMDTLRRQSLNPHPVNIKRSKPYLTTFRQCKTKFDLKNLYESIRLCTSYYNCYILTVKYKCILAVDRF